MRGSRPRRRRWACAAASGALALGLAGCASDYTLTVINNTGVDLVPYPVVTSPGNPPARQADPANTLADGDMTMVDTTGFNPLFYHDGTGYALGVQLGLDDDPAHLLAIVYQYPVPPDAVDPSDPAQQPTVVTEKVFEPTKLVMTLAVGRPQDGFPITYAEADPP